jgi:hypothetical protein
MNASIKARLEKLETAQHSSKHPPAVFFLPPETTEQARARWLADHPGADPETELLFVTFHLPSVSNNADRRGTV